VIPLKRDHPLNLFKHIFGGAAHRTDPTVGKLIERGIGGYIPIGIALCRIIDIATDLTFPFFHLHLLYDLS
jgi:hypothetical protein